MIYRPDAENAIDMTFYRHNI
ncbi:uncharacterized protein FFB20_15880 [Fusarium fujikuroi]|nr:uncharacterized protein FFB20_15880 [Fusarium fujikuroi]